MKKCFKCDVTKSIEEFSKNAAKKDGVNSQCKECHTKYRTEHYNNNKKKYIEKAVKAKIKFREWINKLKEIPCADCKIEYPYYVMDFDHLRDKKFSIGNIKGNDISKEKILKEIEKCEVVCANCHRIRTYNRAQKNMLSSSRGLG